MPAKTVQIRVTVDVAQMVNELAALRGQTAPTTLTGILRPLLRRELEKAMDRRTQELKGEAK